MLEESVEIEKDLVIPLKPAESYTSCSLSEPIKIRVDPENLAELKIQTIPQFFQEICQKHKDLTALAFQTPQADGDGWTYVTYAEYEKNVEQTALVLLHLGVRPHTSVGILAFNCPEWFYVEMAALRIGAVVAGIYASNSAEAVHHVLATSDASVCFVDDDLQMSKVYGVKARLPQLQAVVQFSEPFLKFVGEEPGYYRWMDLFEMQFGSPLREELVMRERDVAANECALLIFTSGTVGMPKGVMVSHDAILFSLNIYYKFLPLLQDARASTVTYMPLTHIAAQMLDLFITLKLGGVVYFAQRDALKGSLFKTLASSKAKLLFGVPRVYEKFQEQIQQIEGKSSGLSKLLMTSCRSLMENYHLDRMENKATSQLKYWFASKMVNRLKVAMGLEHVKGCVVGGAPATEELKKFFLSLDLPLIDAYGLSETSGGVVFNFENSNLKTIGKVMKGIDLKIDKLHENQEGEILVRGRCNLMGYLKDEQKTLEILTEDGFIKTGDLGYIDDQGNVYICGRIKELIITAGGENIPPCHIEAIIKKELPCISNVMVVGDQRKYLTALMTFKTDMDAKTGYPLDTLTPESVQWLESVGCHYTHLSKLLNINLPENLQEFDPNTVELNCDVKVWRALEEGIKRYNEQAISSAQKVQYFTILPHDFSAPTNELGPTLKVKRSFVQTKYAAIIDKMYQK